MMREFLFKAGNPQTQNASISQSQSKLGYADCNLAQDSTEIRFNLLCYLFKNKGIIDPGQRRNFTMYFWNISKYPLRRRSNVSDDRPCKHVSLTCAHCTSPCSLLSPGLSCCKTTWKMQEKYRQSGNPLLFLFSQTFRATG